MKKKRRPTQRRNFPLKLVVLGLLLLVGLGSWLYWLAQDSQYVTEFKIITPEPENTDLVERYVEQYLDTPLWFGLTKRRHRSLIRIEKLEKELLNLFPLFYQADLIVFDQQLVVELQTRKAYALWCQTMPQNEEQCWFIDENRIMYRKAPRFSDGVYVKYSSAIHQTPSIGEQILDETARAYSRDVLDVFVNQNLEPTRIIYESKDRVAISIDKLYGFKVPGDAKIYVSTEQSLQTIDERLQILMATPEFKAEVTASPGLFEYADLRFRGRLVYKLNDA